MKKLVLIAALLLTGCASTVDTVRKYWPRDHDSVAFHQLVLIDVAVEQVDCEWPNWTKAVELSTALARNTEWRADPQAENLAGLRQHTVKMSENSNKTFCEFGKRTALERIKAVQSAWSGR
jgi:hypothetical protein